MLKNLINNLYFLVFYLIAFHCKSFHYIYFDWKFYLTTFTGYLSLFYLIINSLSTDYWFLCVGTIDLVATSVGLSFSLIFLLRLKQINSILYKKSFNRLDLYRFTRLHTQTLVHILQADQYFGSLLLCYIVCLMPFSQLAFMAIVRKNFNIFTFLFFGLILVFIYNGMIGVQLICTVYSNYLHKCRFRLLHWQVNITGNNRFSTRDRLHLHSYIQKFNVKKRYGITLPMICLISIGTFTKFLFFYIENLMFVYQLFN